MSQQRTPEPGVLHMGLEVSETVIGDLPHPDCCQSGPFCKERNGVIAGNFKVVASHQT